IGKRVLRKELFGAEKGEVPLYSANVEPGSEHGWIKQSNIKEFLHPSLLWSIDSDFNLSVRDRDVVFATTDHCGRLELLDPNLDPAYCKAAIIYGYGRTFGFDRVTRPSLTRMAKVTLRVPVRDDGSFDLEAQRDLSREYVAVAEAVQRAEGSLMELKDLKPRAELPKDAKNLSELEDERDAKIAEERLREIKDDPKKVVSGNKLKARLKKLLD
ncbi:MAG: hypothetical protein ACRD2L_23245, partial [Terriglobia bacterium]